MPNPRVRPDVSNDPGDGGRSQGGRVAVDRGDGFSLAVALYDRRSWCRMGLPTIRHQSVDARVADFWPDGPPKHTDSHALGDPCHLAAYVGNRTSAFATPYP